MYGHHIFIAATIEIGNVLFDICQMHWTATLIFPVTQVHHLSNFLTLLHRIGKKKRAFPSDADLRCRTFMSVTRLEMDNTIRYCVCNMHAMLKIKVKSEASYRDKSHTRAHTKCNWLDIEYNDNTTFEKPFYPKFRHSWGKMRKITQNSVQTLKFISYYGNTTKYSNFE